MLSKCPTALREPLDLLEYITSRKAHLEATLATLTLEAKAWLDKLLVMLMHAMWLTSWRRLLTMQQCWTLSYQNMAQKPGQVAGGK